MASSHNSSQLPTGTILLRVISNASQPFEFAVDNDQSISESRSLLEVEVVGDTLEERGPTGRAKVTFRGEVLIKDEQTWGSLQPKTGEKLFVTIPNAPSARPSAVPGAAAYLKPGTSATNRSYAANSKLLEDQRHEDERQKRMQSQQQLAMMEPMIDSLANSPQFLEMMKKMSPELEQIISRNPEIAGELQNPEVIKQMMRAQHDPYALHEMSTQLRLQMNHLQNIPGGSSALEKMAGQILNDNSSHGNMTAADLVDATEANSMPIQGRGANTRSLPNPWASSSSASSSTRNNDDVDSHPPMYPFLHGNTLGGANAAARSATEIQQSNLFHNSNSNVENNLSASSNTTDQPTATSATNIAGQGAMAITDDTICTVSSHSPTSPPLETDPIEFQFPSQLSIILEMGFEDVMVIKRALEKCNGDVDAAVCILYDGEEG